MYKSKHITQLPDSLDKKIKEFESQKLVMLPNKLSPVSTQGVTENLENQSEFLKKRSSLGVNVKACATNKAASVIHTNLK